MKRLFDIVFSTIGLLFLLPFFIIISLLIVIDSKGGVLYKQIRVGKNNEDFLLYKFRSMYSEADKKGLLTVGGKDPRITKIGYFIRKYKVDELLQLVNVLKGDMSLVGPRPEVRKYVNLYSSEQNRVLEVKPGITDVASLEFFNENDILAKAKDPEKTYINEIMPKKLKLNLVYIKEHNLLYDFKLILKTIGKIFS